MQGTHTGIVLRDHGEVARKRGETQRRLLRRVGAIVHDRPLRGGRERQNGCRGAGRGGEGHDVGNKKYEKEKRNVTRAESRSMNRHGERFRSSEEGREGMIVKANMPECSS
jgi:hypothetical protein